jgi:Predicted metal-binding integral membrane protein (DUF2182)
MLIMPAMQHWNAWDLFLVFLMWAIMMVAMMVSTAGPVILLFAEINRRRTQEKDTFIATAQFLFGYLTVWTGFSAVATLAQWGPAHRDIGFADDGEHEPNVRRRIAAYRRPLSVQPSEICLSRSLPIAH